MRLSHSVLFISTMNAYPWGGSEEFWFRLAIWMAQNNYKVDCCFFEWPEGKEEKILALRMAGCTIHLVPNPKMTRHALQKIRIRKKGTALLKKLCLANWSLICISQGGYEDVTHRPFRFLYRLPRKFALLYHNYDESHRLSGSRRRNLEKWASTATLNMSAAARIFEGIKNICGLVIPRQAVLKNPLIIPFQHIAPAWPRLDEGRYVFSMLAHLDVYRKAQDILIKVLSTSKWIERNWILYLYGKGEDMSLLETLVRGSGMHGQIRLMNYTKDVQRALEKTHLLLHITHIDAMPLSVTEAMNMARPCVVSRVGDMPLWIIPEKNGYIASSVTEHGIDQVLEHAWQDRGRWEQMGKEAHFIFTSKYPQPYEKYYADLLMNL